MAITKAKKLFELSKDNKRILVALYEGGQVSSCIQEETKRYCESCQCDDATCQEWIDSLKAKGYQATEYEAGELGIEESLPKFLEEKQVGAPIPSEPEIAIAAEPEIKVGQEENAISDTDQVVS